MLNRNRTLSHLPSAAGVDPSQTRANPPLGPRPPRHWGRAAGVLSFYVGVFFLLLSGSVRCTFATLTHHPCPGCGTTRSAWAMLHGDLGEAFRFNPLGPFVILCLFVLAVESIVDIWKDGNADRFASRGPGKWALYTLFVVCALELVVWVARFFGAFGGPVPV